ncbi:MAG: sigma-54-dependent transcriptional regulator [Ignavibacteriaceae bacterium]
MENILIIDDNQSTIDALNQIIVKNGYHVYTAEMAEEGYNIFLKNSIDLIITDMMLPGISGIELLSKIRQKNDLIPVIIITAYGSVEKAVEAIKLGATDFITKPFTIDEIELKIKKNLETSLITKQNRELSLENEYLRTELSFNFSQIIGQSKTMFKVIEQIKKLADANSPVLLLGESGTGKELVARALHINSHRKNKPFVRIHCAALAQGLLESELFGHEKGAFSGAISKKPGRFEIAGEGSIFLDEIGEISQDLQVKLLRVLQEREFERVGSNVTLKMNARIIAATNRNLLQMVKEGNFREDLFYRLNVVPIEIPPLRERKDDIPVLINHFLRKYSVEANKNISEIKYGVLDALQEYPWPGNIRELENVIERAIVMTDADILSLKDFPENIINYNGNSYNNYESSKININNLTDLIQKYEKELIQNALIKSENNISKASKILGIKRTTLRYKMDKYGLISDNMNYIDD